MNRLPDIPPNHNQTILTVSELSAALKAHIEERFDYVRIRGEISGLHRAGSGHIYFSLKDDRALLEAACWRPIAARLPREVEDGADVIVTGRLTTYASRSRYQVIVESVELAGIGALLKLLEERKRKLTEEGLFAEARKRPLPYLPECIGIVTSPTGAVIRDILHRLRDRFPRHVLLWPVAVQGREAAEQIAAAIRGFNALDERSAVARPDLLIIARGGGSLEDLWAFNEEVLVRATAGSNIPTISAVGHETDTTLIDYAADVRAPTPTAAAELAVPVRQELLVDVLTHQKRLIQSTNRMIVDRRFRLDIAAKGVIRAARLPAELQQQLDQWSDRLRHSPRLLLNKAAQALAAAGQRLVEPNRLVLPLIHRLAWHSRALETNFHTFMARKHHALRLAGSLLESYSHKKTLARGFTIVDDGGGRLITSAEFLRNGDRIRIQFVDGTRHATVDDRASTRRSARSSKARQDYKQGSLL